MSTEVKPLTVAEVSERLGVSDSFVRSLVRSGMLGHLRLKTKPESRGAIRIPRAELDRYMKDSEMHGDPAEAESMGLTHIRL